MKEKVFIDTGFWIALFDRNDEHHQIVKNNVQYILNNFSMCISDFIVFETITYLNCSIKNHSLATTFLERVQTTISINIFSVDHTIKNIALELFKKYSDQYFSDCTSFAIMKNETIERYAGFDKHFKRMGFNQVF